MRVHIVDPSAYTPPYDHALCQALAAAGAEVDLYTSHFAHGPVAAVTHGGITTELLRNLLDDDALPPHLLAAGIPPCAVTMIDNLTVVTIASTVHLSYPCPGAVACTSRRSPRT